MLKHIQSGAGGRAGAAPGGAQRPEPDPRYQNMPRRHLQLNVSTLDSSKHSVGGTSASVSPGAPPPAAPAVPRAAPAPAGPVPSSRRSAPQEALTSLALLCLVSLLLALLSLIFLLRMSGSGTGASSGVGEEFAVVYEVTLALCALTLSLNLCCLLVCAIQFLFAVKLVHSPSTPMARTNKYLQKSAVTRVCAVGGFFISIPVFLTGIILYTFIQFHSTPAIVTSVFIGIGIVFCGCAMVHNVFVWQKEKTNVVKALRSQEILNSTATSAVQCNNGGFVSANGHLPSANTTLAANLSFHSTAGGGPTSFTHPITLLQHQGPYIIRPPTSTPPGENTTSGQSPGMPTATLDLSHAMADSHELSTLV